MVTNYAGLKAASFMPTVSDLRRSYLLKNRPSSVEKDTRHCEKSPTSGSTPRKTEHQSPFALAHGMLEFIEI
jgi:hypothetical protein